MIDMNEFYIFVFSFTCKCLRAFSRLTPCEYSASAEALYYLTYCPLRRTILDISQQNPTANLFRGEIIGREALTQDHLLFNFYAN